MSEDSDGDRSGVDGDDSAPETDAWGRDPAGESTAAADDTADDAALDELEDEEAYEPSLAGVFGASPEDAPPRPEIVPESPELENAVFVLVGVLFGLFVIYRAAAVFAG